MNIIERIDEYLSANGYPHHIDEDGKILIKYLGKTILCDHNENDEMYVRFVMPMIYEIENNENTAEYIYLLKICNSITAIRKCVEAIVANNGVHLSIECYIDPDSSFEQNIKRIFTILNETFFDFHATLSNDENDIDIDDENDENNDNDAIE